MFALKQKNLQLPVELVWWVGGTTLFLFSRLYNLTLLPIFFDESYHIQLALAGDRFGAWLASDGTRLLLIWILRLLLPVTSDILWAGRFVSVLAGLLAAIGCYLVGLNLFNRRVGFIAFILYLTSPFMLSNDRLLMTDVYLVTCAVFTVWLSLIAIKNSLRWWWGVFLGITLGLAVLTKLNGLMVWALPIIVLLVFRPNHLVKVSKVYGLAYLIAVVLSLPMIWILQQGLDVIGYQNANQSTLDMSPISQMNQWLQNLRLLLSWTWTYLTPGLGLAALIALGLGLWEKSRPGLVLIGWIIVLAVPWVVMVQPPVISATLLLPGQLFLPSISVGQEFYPRFILFAFPALFLLVAYVLDWFWQYMMRVGLKSRSRALIGLLGIALLLWPALNFDYRQLRDPVVAPFPDIDRLQYIEGYTSGYGIQQLLGILKTETESKGEIYVAAHDRVSRLMAQLNFEIWQGRQTSIHILGVRPGSKLSVADVYAQLPNQATPPPIYWIADGDSGHYKFGKDILAHIHVSQIASFARPGNRTRLYVYLLSPKSPAMTANLQPAHPQYANLADQMELQGYDLKSYFGLSEQALIEVTLYWRMLQPTTQDYTVFVHLIDANGRLVAQHDGEPSLGIVIPTSTWWPGEWIKDRHILEVPPDLTPGKYQLQAGVYNAQTLEHLPVSHPQAEIGNAVGLGYVTLSAATNLTFESFE